MWLIDNYTQHQNWADFAFLKKDSIVILLYYLHQKLSALLSQNYYTDSHTMKHAILLNIQLKLITAYRPETLIFVTGNPKAVKCKTNTFL